MDKGQIALQAANYVINHLSEGKNTKITPITVMAISNWYQQELERLTKENVPDMISTPYEFKEHIKPGMEYYETWTSYGKPSGVTDTNIFIRIEQANDDYKYERVIYQYKDAKYGSHVILNDMFNHRSERVFLTKEDAEKFYQSELEAFNNNPEWFASFINDHYDDHYEMYQDYDDFFDIEEY